jgi:hypothetical protein
MLALRYFVDCKINTIISSYKARKRESKREARDKRDKREKNIEKRSKTET